MLTVLLLIASIALIVWLTSKLNVHPFLALFTVAIFYGLGVGMSFDLILESINAGFGGTLGKIGLVILFGVIIGSFLENTGAAYKLADIIMKIIGRKRVYEAMGFMGFMVSIPVFADSGFIILNPLNKSLSKKAGVSLAGTATMLMLGLLIAHVLVPPTPGPIAAAGIIGADIGLVMLFGLVIGLMCLAVAVVYCKKVASKVWIDANPELSDLEVEQKINDAPSAVKSFLPILIPILLIVAKSLMEFQLSEEVLRGTFPQILSFLGSPVIALAIGVLFGLMLPKKLDQKVLSESGWVGKSLMSASTVILITGAGGIFGTILKNSGIGEVMSGFVSTANLGIWLPFLLCAAIKTAQGSSTVALITTASIMAPLMTSLGFDSEIQRALVVVAIGAGAMVVCHVNDSGFWVMSRLSGMDIKQGYRTYSLGTLVVGLSAATLVFIASLIF